MTNVEIKKIEKIRASYAQRPIHALDELKALDKRAKTPASVFAYVFGSIGALVLGTGMCLAMKVIGNAMPLGIAIGCVGIVMTALTYLIYKAVLKKRKAKYAKQIFALSDDLLNK